MAEAKESKLDKVLRQIEQLEALKKEAIQELLEERESIDLKLTSLGYKEPEPQRTGATRKRSGTTKEKHCEICDLVGHDKRAHRSQIKKQPFTTAELQEKGLQPGR